VLDPIGEMEKNTHVPGKDAEKRPVTASNDKPISRFQKRMQELEEQKAMQYTKKQTLKTMTTLFENIILTIWKDYLHGQVPDAFSVATIKFLTKKKLGVKILQQVYCCYDYLKLCATKNENMI
jgi:hypothetical protein